MKFLTAGIPFSTPKKDSVSGLMRVAEIGLDGMEMEFVRGVRMKPELAKTMRATAQSLGLVLTAHAPYYVNLNSQEPEKITASIKRILQTVEIGQLAGARQITFHPAYYHEQDPEQVFQQVKKVCLEISQVLKKNNWQVRVCPETTGKASQFGSLEELVRLAQGIEVFGICIDFAHLCTRSNGELNGYEATMKMLDYIEKKLGSAFLQDLYIHLSGIAWGPKGERHHLMIQDPDNLFDAEGCLQALKNKKCDGVIICESPDPEVDALFLKGKNKK